MDKYASFKELEAAEEFGKDFTYIVRPKPGASVAVVAPHGGSIEFETAEIAEAIAGSDFSLYCFKGLRQESSRDLHITSHNFDEPSCVNLVAAHKYILTIHGFIGAGQHALLGGLDNALVSDLAGALQDVGISVETDGHRYPGKHPKNICNRGARNAGAQFELSLPFRRGKHLPLFVEVVRSVLSKKQSEA